MACRMIRDAMKFKKKGILRALKRSGRRFSCHAIDRAHALGPSMTAGPQRVEYVCSTEVVARKSSTTFPSPDHTDAPSVGRRDLLGARGAGFQGNGELLK